MNSTPHSGTEALDFFEASLDSSFSPVCHRTRSQLAAKELYGVGQVGAPSGANLDGFRSESVGSMVDRDVIIAMDDLIDNLPCTPPPATYPCDLQNVSQLVENAILQNEVIDTVSDMLHCVSQGLSPIGLIHDASSPTALPRTFYQGGATLDNITCIAPPSDIIFDESSPLAMPRTFFGDERIENSISPSRPSCDTPVVADSQVQCGALAECMPAASYVPAIDSPVETVVLFPSELEIRDLFPDPHSNLRFDFVHLTCRPCHKRFFSAGGLENHLFAVHNVRPDTSGRLSPSCDELLPPPELLAFAASTGPPPCAPFTRLSPVKTWASVVAQHAITPRQLGTGNPSCKQPAASTTPRLLRTTQPSRALGVPGQITHTTNPPPDIKGRKRITFEKDPDSNSHVVLLPAKPVPPTSITTSECIRSPLGTLSQIGLPPHRMVNFLRLSKHL
ncbi:hypothetical protein CEXT_610261 [Caerostris extrusa]|uniref:C2H2-type domain-containing protein n=1 Tax=Caerostris extrusa TaxID=172846 RepID=A0AAV4Y2V7_CAEEX|nr:hypothetical protein CEXT_610261 [Caerostris extrusa]